MIQSDREAALEFARGASFVMLVVGLFLVFITSLGEFDPPPAEEFAVEGSYKGCDVVRYSPRGKATSHFFLYCGK